MANREGAKDAKENDLFRIGTDDSEKIPALRAISAYCRITHPQVSAVSPSAKLIDTFLLPICASAKENLAYFAS